MIVYVILYVYKSTHDAGIISRMGYNLFNKRNIIYIRDFKIGSFFSFINVKSGYPTLLV